MNRKLLILIDIVLCLITIFAYSYIFNIELGRTVYAEETEKLVDNAENPVFRIDKIVLWSSAYAVDNSDKQLKDIDISQYTDIEIYIDNLSKIKELTPENTVNSLFIDNIKIETDELNRDVRFNYKNPYNCGKFEDISNWQADGILFRIINTNKKQVEADYNDSIFYTDCSNPITLGYLNKDFLTNCEIGGESGLISFDGSILSKVVQDIKKLNTKISFDIHIINNYNENYICKVSFNIDLTDNDYAIDSGYLNKEIRFADSNFIFFKQFK